MIRINEIMIFFEKENRIFFFFEKKKKKIGYELNSFSRNNNYNYFNIYIIKAL
jgi:hypothetical protein